MSRLLVTQGEKLYNFMCNRISRIPEIKSIIEIPNFARRTTKLLEFIDGAIRFHAFARVIRFGRVILDRDDLDSFEDKARELQRLCLEMLEIGQHNCDDLKEFLNLAFDAAKQTNKKIKDSEKRNVRDDYKSHKMDLKCYMCDGQLDMSANQYAADIDLSRIQGDIDQIETLKMRIRPEYNARYVDYDHVWPRSLGGDSIAENLLPICQYCNQVKQNIVSWEWALVQSAVWPPLRGNSNALDNVPKQIKIALHLRAALRTAESFGMSLKSAFMHLGPRQALRVSADDDTSDFFNLEVHDQMKLDSLWE